MLNENAEEAGLHLRGQPIVVRRSVEVAPGRRLSALAWRTGEPQIAFLHGGAQNVHTWDTVALVSKRPLLALDFPGHSHSDWRTDSDYGLWAATDDVAAAMRVLAPHARMVVGMSLGGLIGIALAAGHPDLVLKLALVDITPGADPERTGRTTSFFGVPSTFDRFEDALQHVATLNPRRSPVSLRRGLVHNLMQRANGRWSWRYDPRVLDALDASAVFPDLTSLWDDLARSRAPLMLVSGGSSWVVLDEDVAEVRRRRPDVSVEVIEGAGHSVQGDRPLELGFALETFLDT